MKTALTILLALSSTALAGQTPAAMAPTAKAPTELALEALEFIAPTNLKALTVRGKTNELTGKAWVDGGKLQKVEATVKVESLETGMSMRDQHMRERVFKTADGKLPDLTFTSSSISCPTAGECEVKGDLTIRGVKKDAVFKCKTTDVSADCATTVKLSTYGIEKPSQLGVTVSDDVAVNLKVRKK